MSKNQYNFLENIFSPNKTNTFHENNKFNSNNTHRIYSHQTENLIENIHTVSKNQYLNKLKI